MGYNVLDIVTMEFYTNRLRFQKNTLPRFTTPSISYVEYETRKARRLGCRVGSSRRTLRWI